VRPVENPLVENRPFRLDPGRGDRLSAVRHPSRP
jgi:hypothetical protein